MENRMEPPYMDYRIFKGMYVCYRLKCNEALRGRVGRPKAVRAANGVKFRPQCKEKGGERYYLVGYGTGEGINLGEIALVYLVRGRRAVRVEAAAFCGENFVRRLEFPLGGTSVSEFELFRYEKQICVSLPLLLT